MQRATYRTADTSHSFGSGFLGRVGELGYMDGHPSTRAPTTLLRQVGQGAVEGAVAWRRQARIAGDQTHRLGMLGGGDLPQCLGTALQRLWIELRRRRLQCAFPPSSGTCEPVHPSY
jgi:hypothetical protein